MRLLSTVLLVASLAFGAGKEDPAAKVKPGVKTPGVQIPFSQLKPEAEIPVPGIAGGTLFNDGQLWLASQSKKAVVSVDLKENKSGKTIEGLNAPCGKPASGFGSLWVPDCGAGSVVRIDAKEGKIKASFPNGAAPTASSLAVTTDSLWTLADTKTTLIRIDPDTNQTVSELRLPSGCLSLLSAEEFLWVACPVQNKVLRINPATNLVDKTIETSSHPRSLAYGEGSLWAYCDGEGKLVRIDPKTQKITNTIELMITNGNGEVAFGEGSVWVSATGFPLTRIDPQSNTVAQQFAGDGAGTVDVSRGAVWLANPKRGVLLRFDPKRIAATLSE